MKSIENPHEDSKRSRNISRLPIPKRDERLIIWEVERKKIPPIQNEYEDEQISQNYLRIPEHLKLEYLKLNKEDQIKFNKTLENRNSVMVEFNKIVTALLGCNTNVAILGSEETGKSILCYLLKYVTKSNTGISHSASLILHARRTIEEFPSIAEDTGTPERNAMHLLNRVTNKISCAVEVSANMAALAILGGPTEFVSCSFFHVFVLEALAYIKSHPKYIQSIEGHTSEFENLPGDEFLEGKDLL